MTWIEHIVLLEEAILEVDLVYKTADYEDPGSIPDVLAIGEAVVGEYWEILP